VSLKPQDVCVLLKIVALDGAPWSYGQLAYELGMSASEVHAAVRRATEATLMRVDEGWGQPDAQALAEFLVHGLKYVFAPERGGLTTGIPTASAAPPLDRLLAQDGEPPPVWPDEAGEVRGLTFVPLYKSVPHAARRDAKLYELLALVDAIRGGDEDAREVAVHELRARLGLDSAPVREKRRAQAASVPAASKRGK
jgi:hypothetical protein